jgi:putative ABC transport system permease protein
MVFSAINIFGLSTGLAICLLIGAFANNEFQYDKYNKKSERIFRVNTDWVVNGNVIKSVTSPPPMGYTLLREYPNIENMVRIKKSAPLLINKGDEKVIESDCYFADSTMFEVFTLPLISGDPKTALSRPDFIVLSEKMAKKYFNSTDIIGKTITTDNTNIYTITGIIKDVPVQSHFHFSFIKSMYGRESSKSDVWLNPDVITYLVVRSGTTEQMLNNYLAEAAKKYLEPQVKNLIHSSFDDLEKKGDHLRFVALPLLKIHLNADYKNELEPSGNAEYVYIFMVIGVLIMLIACINFMNLSTARSTNRAKEIGVRKVLGSGRASLIAQFLFESIITSFIALILALGIAWLLLPYFESMSGTNISLQFFSPLLTLPILLCICVIVGLMAGSYPAFFLSSFSPVQVLKGKFIAGPKDGWFRNCLVVFQFAVTIILIIGTLVIYAQLNFIRNKKIGYEREQVLVLKMGNGERGSRAFKTKMLSIPGIEKAALTSVLPTSSNWEDFIYFTDASLSNDKSILLATGRIDADYLSTLGIEMVKGRNFSPELPTDSTAVIINETAAQLLAYADPLNKTIYEDAQHPLHIIGVTKDFNTGSLRNKTKPVAFTLTGAKRIMALRINTQNTQVIIDLIKRDFRAMYTASGMPFDYSFLDDDFNNLYQSEQRTGKVFTLFTGFAILIACLGLLGLASYAANQRKKEISVRKVMGASLISIVGLLSKDFFKLVLIALIIAFPVGWWIMHKWLQDFAYRTGIGWQVFALSGLSVICIALLTISYQVIKTALANPISRLRSE